MAGKISTADILRRGLTSDNISDTCCHCRRERESIDHLFIQCHVASFIWVYFLNVSGVSWCLPRSLPILFEAWKGTLLVGIGRILWKIIPLSILWSIWNERNYRIFNRKGSTMEDLLSAVLLRITKWACVRKDFVDIKIDNIMQNWGVCLKMGALKKKRKVSWCTLRLEF